INKEKVYIIGHIPPGAYPRGFFPETGPNFFYFHSFNKKFTHIVNTYHDVIVGQFFGHLHLDSFMLFSDNQTVLSSLFLSPAVTPWYEPNKELYSPVNPAVRLYKYNRTSGTILDYSVYFLNLTKANSHNNQGDVEQPHDSPSGKLDTPQDMLSWELLYTFTEAYNLSDVSTSSLARLHDKLVNSVETFQRYFQFSTVQKVMFPCNSTCRHFHLCSVANVDLGAYNACVSMQEYATTPDFSQDYNVTSPTSYPASISEIFPDNSEPGEPEPVISDAKPEPESHTTRNVLVGISIGLVAATLIIGIVLLRKRARLFRGPRYVFFP
ncbi:acid sphingomyelinase-like phosphodiesterase 3b, partial [Limulus polyphemus]|uniref:Acid sphingomyelinase-like phosphodiesterase 3b n=1 Tax=Limulus polyphemus TaxID=6850 RepID=A0ABM1BVQ5_LIMPO